MISLAELHLFPLSHPQSRGKNSNTLYPWSKNKAEDWLRTTKKDRCCWNIRVSKKRSKKVIEKRGYRTSAQERLSIFRLRAQSTRSVIISQFGVFWTDRYRAGRPRAQGLWFTMETVYYSGYECLWDGHSSVFVFCGARERERERQKEEQRTKEEKERGRERREGREAALYLLSLFTGEVRGMEGDNLDTLVLGAPQPAILLFCPPALRPPGTPSEEGWTTPISPCSTTPKHFHKASEHSIHGLLQIYNVLLWITTVCPSDLKQRLCRFSWLHFL